VGTSDGRGPVESRSIELAAGAAAPAEARSWIDWLAGYLEPGRLESARLIVSELVTNSVLHAGLADGAPIVLSARADRHRVRMSVWDRGRGLEAVGAPRLPPPTSVGHRGLWIVNQLADRVLIEGADGRVTIEIPRAA
jgi:anti-sigma regulatory factor (Ser/Thr protein kinase)